ncbi:hypothetical protein G7K_0404-t1 [Saitoella complicata NRRL Y-17804]|uniref:AB hydrolase-1 domain-containing protein n=1 Tax=Saitoella complicata (strain BCRC 22490 / CBS 7301 / JCM 7358 / NBRC 10748 / NRRL Y-17804) TaxID=698492 RepID=A0A0E9N8D4_SAICN|nr:hypothetical protein G7K_0404-t1 [Saitoella complicata NRRL Y-17804]
MSGQSFDTSRWTSRKVLIAGIPSTPSEVLIAYTSCPPPPSVTQKGTIILIHGFPQTSYQFRHVIGPLSEAGYFVVAPDYRGAGDSSKPRDGYEKSRMAEDIYELVTKNLGIKEKVHIVGHDIGGMVAHAYATRFAEHTASVTVGEFPLPGTKTYEEAIRNEPALWHFHFHWQTDLPELLTQGRERQYIKHFYDRLGVNSRAISPTDVDVYAGMFEKAGAMRAGFDVYRAFHKDAEENKAWLKENGKCTVPCMSLCGGESGLAEIAPKEFEEVYEGFEVATVEGSGHWCAEENPQDFVKKVLGFVEKHPA